MKLITHRSSLITLFLFFAHAAHANFITANPGNYTSYLNTLSPGDTLFLSAGTYTQNLKLNNINGTELQPIVITGAGLSTVLQGQACCNTVSITKCSYLVISNFKLDGLNEFVDALKAEGTSGNWAHHITIENLYIVNYGFDQQAVGISTKCSAWNWIIRKNKIIGAGTGMYLGNSDGTRPFVNGLIENNYIANTIGYNIEIKHQLNGVRDEFPGTAVNGKTIIRYNVFSKDENASTGGNARPNLLVGGFPLNGWGATDYYEIYGNFFYQNPEEALFQGTGNITMYENVFVNHYDPNGVRAVYITPQNGVSPQDIKVFHNTIWAKNSNGGLRLLNPNTNYHQYCYGNAVFAPSAITNFTESLDNITDTYSNAGNYVLSATTSLSTLNLYPKTGQLTGSLTPSTLFQANTNWNQDFNADLYNWTFRGAYSGCCNNPGWQLQMDTMPTRNSMTSTVFTAPEEEILVNIYPNPGLGEITLRSNVAMQEVKIFDLLGQLMYAAQPNANELIVHLDKPGIYFAQITQGRRTIVKKIAAGEGL